jgi:hemolysin activation/secretion protein
MMAVAKRQTLRSARGKTLTSRCPDWCRAFLLAALPLLAMPSSAADAAQTPNGATDASRFDVWEIRVSGNSVMPVRDVERVVYPFLGPQRAMADIEAARTALEAAFHDRGFGTVFVDIPEQEVADGLVRLHVTEGKLNAVTLAGAHYFSGRAIRSSIPAAAPGTVPHLPTLQHELAGVNSKTADRVVTPVLKAGPQPGTVDLGLAVRETLPVHASAEINDAYTADTTRLRAIVAVSYDNMFGRLDSASLQYQTAPQDMKEVDVLAASYAARLTGSDARLAAFYVNSNSDVATVGAIAVLGKGSVYGLRLINPLGEAVSGAPTLTLGVDYKDFAENIRLDPDSSLQTPISYVNWSAAYGGSWHHDNLQFAGSLAANFGLRGVGNDAYEFENKRFRARPNYLYLRGDANVVAPLPLGTAVSISLAAQGALEPVIANEQFPIGGAEGVRGYLEAEALGDTGIKSSVQFGSPRWKWFADRVALDAFAFADYGIVSTLQPLPGEPSSTDLGSIGLGLNFTALSHLSGELAFAYPLLDGPRTQAGDSRIHFALRTTW